VGDEQLWRREWYDLPGAKIETAALLLSLRWVPGETRNKLLLATWIPAQGRNDESIFLSLPDQ
jgi:hypothetical protein